MNISSEGPTVPLERIWRPSERQRKGLGMSMHGTYARYVGIDVRYVLLEFRWSTGPAPDVQPCAGWDFMQLIT